MKAHPLRILLVIFAVLCATVLSTYVVRILRQPRAQELFQRYVIDPVPASVAHIKVDQQKMGHDYVFRFDINIRDLELIRQSRPFRAAQIAGYMGGGSLCWVWKNIPTSGEIGERSHAFSVYGRKGAPSWYDLESWDNPETHVLVTKGKRGNTSDIQVLTYNAELGSAFFIIWHDSDTVPFPF